MTIWTPWQIKPEIDTNLDPKEVGYPSTIAQIEKTVPAEHYHDFGVYQKSQREGGTTDERHQAIADDKKDKDMDALKAMGSSIPNFVEGAAMGEHADNTPEAARGIVEPVRVTAARKEGSEHREEASSSGGG